MCIFLYIILLQLLHDTSHNKVTILCPYVRSYSYPFNARTPTCATPVPVTIHVLVYMPVTIRHFAISYETTGAKRTKFSETSHKSVDHNCAHLLKPYPLYSLHAQTRTSAMPVPVPVAWVYVRRTVTLL